VWIQLVQDMGSSEYISTRRNFLIYIPASVLIQKSCYTCNECYFTYLYEIKSEVTSEQGATQI
jgi:hypothetical protein